MSARSYPLDKTPLGFADVLTCVRDSVAAALCEPHDTAAAAFRAGVAWLLPGYARSSVDAGWTPTAADDWLRLAAYSGAVDGWEGAFWRGARGQPAEQMEAFAAAYTVARTATINAVAAAKRRAS